MRDRRGHGASPDAEAGRVAEPDPAGGVVALDDGGMGEVGAGLADREHTVARRQAAALDTHRAHARPRCVRQDELLRGGQRPDVHRPAHQLGDGRCRDHAGHDRTVGGHQPARLPDARRPPRPELVEAEDVRLHAGAEAAEPVKAVVAGRVGGCEQERVDLGQPGRHREPRAVVDVAGAQQRVGLAVVGAERREVRAMLEHVGEQRLEVLAGRALADEHPHALAPALDDLVQRRRLVVGLDARCEIGIEAMAGDSGAVPVDAPPAGGPDAGEHLGVAGDHAGEVHDLGHATRSVLLDQPADVLGVERGP